jgi:hypothetical protein
LFDDSGLDDALAIGPVFGDSIDNQLKELDAELRKVDDRLAVQELMTNPTLSGHVKWPLKL